MASGAKNVSGRINVSIPHFLLFQQCFQEPSFPRNENQGLYGKYITVLRYQCYLTRLAKASHDNLPSHDKVSKPSPNNTDISRQLEIVKQQAES